MDDDESIEEIETINRSLAPVATTSSQNDEEAENSGATRQQSETSTGLGANAFNPIFFLLLNTTLNVQEQQKDIKKSIDYLKQVKEPEAIIDDEQAISCLIDINDAIRKNRDKISLVIEGKLQIVLKDLIQYSYDVLCAYVDKGEFNIQTENTDPKFTTFHLICDLNEILTVSSKEYAALFHMIGGTKNYLTFFTNQNLTDYMTKSHTKSDPFRTERKMNYCKALASMLNSLLYLKNNRTQSFRDLRAIETLTSFANALKFENCELILRSHFALAVVAFRRHIETLENIDFTILILEKTVQMFAQACQKKTKYNSYQFDLFYENDTRTFEITSNNSPNGFIVTILSVMDSFLVNEETKYRVFGTIKNSLLILLVQGDVIEKYFALSLLINFAFDDVLNEKTRLIPNISTVIDQLIAQSQGMDETVLGMIYCLKSLLNINTYVKNYRNSPNASSGNNRQIIISYNDVNELVAMKIRNELEKSGFDVALLERKENGKLSIEYMMRSLEQRGVFLMCMSPSYEFDKLNQFEAEYACKLRKTIIPVNIQAKYTPDYWLESMVENTNVIQFNLSNLKNDLAVLRNEIVHRTNPKYKSNNNNNNPFNEPAKPSRTCTIL